MKEKDKEEQVVGRDFTLLPYEIQEFIVWQVGGRYLKDDEKKQVLGYAERKDTLQKSTTRQQFLSQVIKTITYWPEGTRSVVPLRMA